MTERKILRITGILFSLLIIASVFLPYNSVNNMPLFSIDNPKELLLPAIIITFGVISIILYLLNRHCEFALSTSGAVLFFTIIEAVYAVGNKTMNEFNIGYFILAGGAVLLFINTIIVLVTGIKNKKESLNTSVSTSTADNSLEKVYANESPIVEPVQQPIVEPMQQPIVEPVQQPIVEPVQQSIVEPVQQPIVEPVQQPIVEPMQQPIVEPVQPVMPVEQPVIGPVQELKPIVDTSVAIEPVASTLPEIQFEQMQEYKEPITPLYEEKPAVKPEENIALKSLLEPSPVGSAEPVNPVVNDFNQPTEPVNPVLQQFDQPMSFIGQPIVEPTQQHEPPNEGVGMSIFDNH